MKTGLVLEGGGMRGGYTAGVLDAFLDEGIAFSYCIGVSAGACNALSYIGKQRKRYYYANTRYLKDSRYMGIRSLLKTGYLFGNRFVFDDITLRLVPLDFAAFQRESPHCPLTVVTTDCQTGKPRYDVIQNLTTEMKLVEASSSLPILSPMVSYQGRLLMDGGISDSVPVRRALEDGCEKLVVILTQAADYRKSPNQLMPLIRRTYHAYPRLVRLLEKRHIVYNETLDFLAEQEREGKVLIIRPQKPVEIGRMERNPEKITALYEDGLQDGAAVAARVRSFCAGSLSGCAPEGAVQY